MRFRCFVALACAVLLFSMTTYAQVSINGSLRGRVSDPGNAALAGAALTLVNTATSVTQKATSNDNGEYQFARVPPGIYMLTAEKDGFKRGQRESIIIAVNENAVADLALTVGQISETVTIEGGANLVQSQSVELSQLVAEKRIKELPLNGKNFQRLMLLSPGAGGGDPSNPSISGGRVGANTYALDGLNMSDERTTGIAANGGPASSDFGGVGVNILSTEAIQEFRIITSNADATFGRSSSAQVNIVTKSGSNEWHGSAYEYLRNNALDARDFFNYGPYFNSDGSARTPPFKQDLFGGTFGGPIYRNKHFFFGSYEGFRQRSERTATTTVPNAALIGLMPGDLSKYFKAFFVDRGLVPANGNPAGTFSALPTSDRAAAVAAGFNAALFDGNAANGEAGTVLVSNALRRNVKQDAFLVRTDHRLTEKLNASVRFGYANPNNLSAVNAASPIDVSRDPYGWKSTMAQFDYALSPAQILEVRAGVQRIVKDFGEKPDGIDSRLGLDPRFGLYMSAGTNLGIEDFYISPSPDFLDHETIPQVSAIHTWTHGALTLRTGADWRRLIINTANPFSTMPTITFDTTVGPTGILGSRPGQPEAFPASLRATVYGTNGGPQTALRGFRSTQQEYFAQSDWRLTRSLTLNAGLRYSYFNPYSEVNGAASNLYARDNSGQLRDDLSPFALGRAANEIALVTNGRRLYQPDRNNFQPRLGVAWNSGGRNRTVLRAGYGLFIDRIYSLVFSGIQGNIPYATATTIGYTATAPTPFKLGAAIVGTAAAAPSITGIDPTIRNPETHRYNIAIEQQLWSDASVTVAYVGQQGRMLLRLLEPNGSGSVPLALRPDPRFSDQRLVANFSESSYDALQVSARRRFSRGLDFTLAYTFGRMLDDVSVDRDFVRFPSLINLGANPNLSGVQGGGTQFVARPVKADWGYSDLDVRHNLTISHVFELPFGKGRQFLSNLNGVAEALLGGWSWNGILVLRSGDPFTVTLGRDVNDDGDASRDRPQLLSGNVNDFYASNVKSGAFPQFLLPQTDANARLGVPGNVTDPFAAMRRNEFRSPSVRLYDAALLKRFRLTERFTLGFEANAFNLFNRAQFAAPVRVLSNTRFGRVTNTRTGTNPRQIQFGLKLSF